MDARTFGTDLQTRTTPLVDLEMMGIRKVRSVSIQVNSLARDGVGKHRRRQDTGIKTHRADCNLDALFPGPYTRRLSQCPDLNCIWCTR